MTPDAADFRIPPLFCQSRDRRYGGGLYLGATVPRDNKSYPQKIIRSENAFVFLESSSQITDTMTV